MAHPHSLISAFAVLKGSYGLQACNTGNLTDYFHWSENPKDRLSQHFIFMSKLLKNIINKSYNNNQSLHIKITRMKFLLAKPNQPVLPWSRVTVFWFRCIYRQALLILVQFWLVCANAQADLKLGWAFSTIPKIFEAFGRPNPNFMYNLH